jgi:hypothetical protein
VGVTGGWFRNVLAFAVVLALSLAVAWLFDNYDLVSGTFFWGVDLLSLFSRSDVLRLLYLWRP